MSLQDAGCGTDGFCWGPEEKDTSRNATEKGNNGLKFYVPALDSCWLLLTVQQSPCTLFSLSHSTERIWPSCWTVKCALQVHTLVGRALGGKVWLSELYLIPRVFLMLCFLSSMVNVASSPSSRCHNHTLTPLKKKSKQTHLLLGHFC